MCQWLKYMRIPVCYYLNNYNNNHGGKQNGNNFKQINKQRYERTNRQTNKKPYI